MGGKIGYYSPGEGRRQSALWLLQGRRRVDLHVVDKEHIVERGSRVDGADRVAPFDHVPVGHGGGQEERVDGSGAGGPVGDLHPQAQGGGAHHVDLAAQGGIDGERGVIVGCRGDVDRSHVGIFRLAVGETALDLGRDGQGPPGGLVGRVAGDL
ncbi:MAG: hypothetical protein JW900_06655 [Anaerolineae bacterium]|nr:hypothetical protein [Anaerolineae bacterium]